MEDLLFFPDGNRLHARATTARPTKARKAWRIKTLHLTRTLLRFSGAAE